MPKLFYNYVGDEIVIPGPAPLNIDDDLYGFPKPAPELAFNLVPVPSLWIDDGMVVIGPQLFVEDSTYYLASHAEYNFNKLYIQYNEDIAFIPPPPMIDDYGWTPPLMAAGLTNRYLVINNEEIVVPSVGTPGNHTFFAGRRAIIHLR